MLLELNTWLQKSSRSKYLNFIDNLFFGKRELYRSARTGLSLSLSAQPLGVEKNHPNFYFIPNH